MLSLGLIGISYADDSQEAIESEIAAFEAKLEAELAAQEMMAEIVARQAALEAFAQKLIDEKSVGGTKPPLLQYKKRLWVAVIATKIKSYWNYSGADDDWSCNVIVHQNENGKVLTVNIQDCKKGSNALMADDKARSFKNSIERAVYKASPLPIAPDEAVFRRELMFYFRAI